MGQPLIRTTSPMPRTVISQPRRLNDLHLRDLQSSFVHRSALLRVSAEGIPRHWRRTAGLRLVLGPLESCGVEHRVELAHQILGQATQAERR
jgi:hypothetical protein